MARNGRGWVGNGFIRRGRGRFGFTVTGTAALLAAGVMPAAIGNKAKNISFLFSQRRSIRRFFLAYLKRFEFLLFFRTIKLKEYFAIP
jgi:hypothetical protein